jgi:hypothetical protein
VHLAAAIIVVAFGLFLIGFTVVVFVRPTLAERFLAPFASSARAHYTEQGFRLVIGAALIVLAPAMSHPNVFRLIAWAIVIPSVALILAPWQWHQRFGAVVRPKLIRYMKLFALGLFAFGLLLLYGVFASESNGITTQG